ncbi:MAG: eukaryotic-like serine/threonine-protein kinase [Gammaproteobacteria bacterium]|jgi:serine/threonine protein kinase|nr:eukaryotic-like serine/threonine-protein kinase [Gammaproteobacteria bacterium]
MSTQVPREKAVFVEALEIADPEQRRQFLDQACGADQALRERVEKLLALSQSAGDFFKDCAPALEPAPADAAQVLSASESALETEIPETKWVGPYKLLQKLGEGGYGVVYMAEQEQPIRRRVALKIIKLGMDTRNVIARFEAERQALALMEHPNIARVLDAGATETGRPYFVMELVYGVKFTEYCDQNRVGMQERLELFIQVCNAVQHAHQKGIIHRDLKPSNIMVTMRDGVPVPKVIDFGIAKAIEQRLTDLTLFTSYAQLMGTPAYMSPEQMEFSGLNLDTRSDIYSLGVLLYELLTSHTPFDTTELLKSGVDELRRTVREREPLSPSAKLRTLNNEDLTKAAGRLRVEPPRLVSQLRGDLDWIVLKCLEKDRTRRYATASGLAEDIERCLKEETVLARPPSQLYRLQKLVRRHRMVFLFGAAGVAALLLGTIFSTLMFLKEREAKTSEARLRKEAELREKASQVASFVTQGRFGGADKLVAGLPLDKPSIEVAAALRAIGDWHAANFRWSEAAARFKLLSKVNQLDTSELISEDQLKLAVALLKSDQLTTSSDRRGYENFRASMRTHLAAATAPPSDSVVKACLLLAPDQELLELLVSRLGLAPNADTSAAAMRGNPHRSLQWSETMALLEYRRGNFAKVTGSKFLVTTPPRQSLVLCINSMARWRVKDYWPGMADWIQAFILIQAASQQELAMLGPVEVTPNMEKAERDQGAWYDWAIAGVLMRECNEVIAMSEQSLDPRPAPEENTLMQMLRDWHALRGEWAQSRQLSNTLLDLNSNDTWDDFATAVASLKLGDEAGYLLARDAAIARFGDTASMSIADSVLKVSLLRPTGDQTTASLERFAVLLSDRLSDAKTRNEPEPKEAWYSMVLGLYEYRRGNYTKAISWAQRSLDTTPGTALPIATDHLIMAMSLHKVGGASAARLELKQTENLLQSGFDLFNDFWSWRDWVYVRLLLLEAKALIPDEAPPPVSKDHGPREAEDLNPR